MMEHCHTAYSLCQQKSIINGAVYLYVITHRLETFVTHCGWGTHICVNKLTIIGSDNGLSTGRHKANISTNAEILLIGPLGTNLNENANNSIVVAILSRLQCINRCYECMFGDFVVLNIWVPLTFYQRFSFGRRTTCINRLGKAIWYLHYSTAHLMPQIFLVIWIWRTSLFSTNMEFQRY